MRLAGWCSFGKPRTLHLPLNSMGHSFFQNLSVETFSKGSCKNKERGMRGQHRRESPSPPEPRHPNLSSSQACERRSSTGDD